MLSILAFIIAFTVVAVSHELGHLVAAKLSGIEVFEFALGFGPRLLSIKRGKTLYCLNLVPVGGYVKLSGLDPENDPADIPESWKYYNRPLRAKFWAIVAGPAINLVIGCLLIFMVFAFVGMPKGVSSSIESVSPGSEAENAGLLAGDQLISAAGFAQKALPTVAQPPDEIIKTIHQSAGQKLRITILRNGHHLSLAATPKLSSKLKVGLLGITLRPQFERVPLINALKNSVTETFSITIALFSLLGKLITGQEDLGQLAGPIGIAQISGQSAQAGLVAFISFIAFFSINVGVLNLLPIPALDGGRLVFIALEALRRKPISIKIENQIHAIGMIAFLVLLAGLTIQDLFRITYR